MKTRRNLTFTGGMGELPPASLVWKDVCEFGGWGKEEAKVRFILLRNGTDLGHIT